MAAQGEASFLGVAHPRPEGGVPNRRFILPKILKSSAIFWTLPLVFARIKRCIELAQAVQ